MTNDEVTKVKRLHDKGMRPKMIANKLERSFQWVTARLAAAGVVSERAKQRANPQRPRSNLSLVIPPRPARVNREPRRRIGDLTEPVDVAFRRVCG